MPNSSPSVSPRPAAGTLQPSDHERLALQQQLFEQARPWLPRDPFPHFMAHVRLQSAGQTSDVLFTHEAPLNRARPGAGLVIAHYQTSAFASVLFGCQEGDPYQLRGPTGTTTGTVLERNLVSFRDGELVEVLAPDRRLSREAGAGWQRFERPAPLLEPRPAEAQERAPSLIDVTLDPTQQGVVDLPPATSVLVLGEAGHGKTTVALHRLARLMKAAPSGFRAAVIVPTDGLRRLIEPLLVSLGVDVEVEIYERWARRQALRAFADLPRRESEDATAGVIRFKRDPALRSALGVLASPKRPRSAGQRAPRGRRPRARRRDLLHLFGDRTLVTQVMRHSAQPFGPHVLAEVLEHTHVQFSRTSEQAYAHVDRERLRAVDGRPLDEGTPWQDAGSIDAEDYAVLFELDRLRAEQLGAAPVPPRAYDCILLDEAQEFAPLELALIGRSLAPGGTLIVAGDADQQTDPGAHFASWEHSMTELGSSGYARVVLPVSYRCPAEVVSIARRLLPAGQAEPPPKPAGAARAHGGSAPRFVHFLNECHLGVWLVEELRQLAQQDRSASVAVICRRAETARRVQRALRHAGLGRLVVDGEFAFHSGVNVTYLDQVKGLEFDHVIVPDASAATYPDTPEARRALYVAVTRARHQLVLGAVAGQTPLLALPGAPA